MDSATGDSNLYQWVEGHARERPDSVAVTGVGPSLTWAQLVDNVDRVSGGLASLGVEPGDVVAAQLPNIPEFLILLLAAVRRGAILQTLHMPYREAELGSLLRHGRASAVVVPSVSGDRRPVDELLSLKSSLPDLRHVITVGEATPGTSSFGDLVTGGPVPAPTPAGPDDPFLLLYTSGTTSGPKGVAHTSRRFLGNAAGASDELGLTPGDRVTSLAPFTHLYGLFTLHIALAAGATTAMVTAFHPPTLIPTLEELSPTALFTAPAHLAPFVDAGRFEPALFEPTRFVCLSGSTVPPALARAVDDLVPDGSVIGLWGMTEIQVGTFGRPHDPLDTRVNTAGRAAPGMELRIVDGGGTRVEPGGEGELQVRGPSVFDSYLRDPVSTAEAFTADGWFRTGDLARIDENGFVTLTGRTKEIINRGGIKYNPAEVEAIVGGHPAVAACAVVPVPDPVLGERGCLCVQTHPGSSVDLEQVKALLDDHRVAKFKWPERLELFDELPMTPTRKVRRGELRAMISP